MKKLTAIVLIASALLFCLASCKKEDKDADTTYLPGQTFTVSETTAKAPEKTVTPGADDYDSDGNLILKSTANRYVYNKESGYVIFSFNASTGSCFQVLDVKEFDSEEEADKYLSENVVEQMASGEYTNVIKNGKYVVFTASVDNTAYGTYLKGDRAAVEKAFPDDLKQ